MTLLRETISSLRSNAPKFTIALMLATVFTSAAHADPLRSLVHLHPHVSDTRIGVSLFNRTAMFQEFMISGETYTIKPHTMAFVQAPLGTTIYAGFNMREYHKGSVLLQVTNSLNGKTIYLR